MAIQFPNFLNAQTAQPDYSGIGDAVSNFYAGYNMPNDALIKKIQAQFAQPAAEQEILNSKLTNKKSQLDIDKLSMDLNQQRAFENQLRQALMGNSSPSSTPAPSPIPGMIPTGNQTPMPMQTGVNPGASTMPAPMGVQGVPTAQPIQAGSDSQSTLGAATSSSPADAMNEIVISKGSPQLAGIDAMWDNNPLSRAFLETKGFKKSQDIKFDPKTGKTTIITKYPSNKITTQTSAGAGVSDEGIPLTNKMISKHQNIISSIDNALPIIQRIIDQGGKDAKGLAASWEPYPRSSGYFPGLGHVPGFQSSSIKYEALVSSVLDSLVGAYGLPSTDQGLETVRQQLLIGHGETDSAYRKRLKNLVEDLQRRREYSSSQVKKSNKIQPIDSSANGNNDADDGTYSSNDWEPA